MKTYKIHLLAATAAASLISTAANAAPPAYPAAEINGNGATSVATVVSKENNCLGNATNKNLGFGDGTSADINEHLYQPASPTISNPVFDCGDPHGAFTERSIQPDLTVHYISTGSSAGRNNWAGFVATNGITTNPFGSWSNIQYAFSEGPISGSNLTTYNTNARGTLGDHDANAATPDTYNKAGPAVQIPYYVVPIAIAYSPVYGKKNVGGVITPLSFNVKSTFQQKDGAGVVVGGLRLSKQAYCNIANGVITNWNDAALQTLNGGQSLMDPNDDPTRWSTTGVPIKLVGRSDGSGGTTLFTRHLDAIAECNGGQMDTGAGGTDTLPVAARSTAVYSKSTGVLQSGTEVAGKWGLSNGSDGVSNAVGQPIPDPAVGAFSLGGYVGYLGADWVRPASLGTSVPLLHSAALQQGNTTTYKMPTAANATAAFGTAYLPPESCTNGKFCPVDGRTPTNTVVNPAAGSTGLRGDPTAWVLPANATTGLANPALGYPIVGTANVLLYTCYSTPGKRLGIAAMAGLNFGKVTMDSLGAKVPAALANSTGKGADLYPLGILAANGLANLPPTWKTAVWDTFFSNLANGNRTGPTDPRGADLKIGGLNLWIQDKLPTTAALIDGSAANGEIKSNPVCTSGLGA